MIELVLVVPILFLLVVLAMNFGGLINAWVAVENATRSAADYAVLGGASATLPPPATSGSLQALINAEINAIPSLTNTRACVRENDNGNYTNLLEMPSGACASYPNPPSDGEPIAFGTTVAYANLAVDVTCTYTSFFSGAKVMGLSMPLLPSSIHRRTVMRILQ